MPCLPSFKELSHIMLKKNIFETKTDSAITSWLLLACQRHVWIVHACVCVCMLEWTGTHYSDVIMSAMASQITNVSIVCSTVCSGVDKKNTKAPRHCPACRTTLVATRFRVAVICPIIQVPHCIRGFFYFVWFVFINHIFQFYYELCTYCNILDIYLS